MTQKEFNKLWVFVYSFQGVYINIEFKVELEKGELYSTPTQKLL